MIRLRNKANTRTSHDRRKESGRKKLIGLLNPVFSSQQQQQQQQQCLSECVHYTSIPHFLTIARKLGRQQHINVL